MPHAEHTVTILRPAEDVFGYLADGTHNPEWRSGVIEIRRTSAADGPAATTVLPCSNRRVGSNS
jgi:hypothetical protein